MRGRLNIEPVREEDEISNFTHDESKGKECVVLEAEIGKPAWFAVKMPNDRDIPWHRIRTSVIKNLEQLDNELIIYTENSIYYIRKD